MDNTLLIHQLSEIVGSTHVIFDPELLYRYTADHVSGATGHPICAVRPASTDEVSQIVVLCDQNSIGVSIRGGGSSVSGGILSGENEVVLSLERLNRILEINRIDRYVVAEAGVVTQDLQDELLKHDLWFPQNISSAAMSFIGGNVAISSGSPKSMKYGSTKNYVLNLEVVLPNGSVIWTGKNVRKNAAGFNLTQLITGSEGTLGIITRVVLQVVPPQKEILVLVPFKSMESLFNLVDQLFTKGFNPSSLEFLDSNACELGLSYLDQSQKYGADVLGLLWIEFESESDALNFEKIEMLEKLFQKQKIPESFVGQSRSEINALWECRKRIGEAAISKGHFDELDIVVPRSKSAAMYGVVEEVCINNEVDFIVVGHVGDGNFHIILFKDRNTTVESWQLKLNRCTEALFGNALELGGDISGEHGIGRYNRSHFARLQHPENLNLMKKIKKAFDPNNTLNPQNIFISN